jgi:hypothetical protein
MRGEEWGGRKKRTNILISKGDVKQNHLYVKRPSKRTYVNKHERGRLQMDEERCACIQMDSRATWRGGRELDTMLPTAPAAALERPPWRENMLT